MSSLLSSLLVAVKEQSGSVKEQSQVISDMMQTLDLIQQGSLLCHKPVVHKGVTCSQVIICQQETASTWLLCHVRTTHLEVGAEVLQPFSQVL